MEGCSDPVSVKVDLKKGLEKTFWLPKEKLGCFESLFFENVQKCFSWILIETVKEFPEFGNVISIRRISVHIIRHGFLVSVAQKPVALLLKINSAYFRGTRLKRAKSLSPPCEKVPECLFNFSGQDDVEGLRVIMTATRCRDDSAARPPAADTLDESQSLGC